MQEEGSLVYTAQQRHRLTLATLARIPHYPGGAGMVATRQHLTSSALRRTEHLAPGQPLGLPHALPAWHGQQLASTCACIIPAPSLSAPASLLPLPTLHLPTSS